MKLYKVNKWDIKIEEIEAIRTSDSSFWDLDYNGKERRNLLKTTYNDHFETWDGAKNHLIAREDRKLQSAIQQVSQCEKRLEEAKNIQP